MTEPKRVAVVKRSAEYDLGGYRTKMENDNTTLMPKSDGLYAILNNEWLSIPAGQEEEVIRLLRWVQEERARWSVLQQSDKAGI